MINLDRKGVVGFVITMALGVALGAATLVVGNEIVKKRKEEKTAPRKEINTPQAVEQAYENYKRAYKEYQQAVGMGRSDSEKYAAQLSRAKKDLEWAILKNTPGVSEMDLTGIETGSSSGGQNRTQNETELRERETADSGVRNEAVQASMVNPFSENTQIVIDGGNNNNQGTGVESNDSSSSASPDGVGNGISLATSQNSSRENSSSEQTLGSEDQVYGMEYYKVRSGDSLSRICQRYYGDSGMWTHILKYQIPSIAATPNLIFPGQLIALPRGLTPGRTNDSFVSPSSPGSSSSDEKSASGNYDTAPPGDESWQNSFQRDYLISDHTLTRTDTMTVAQIQGFLDKKGSCLARPYRGSTPAQMIYDAAKKYGINPQVLLTRLQCEQGLISKRSASQHKLDWALGVGAYDSGNWNQRYKGLDKQIEYAAATYRRHFDNAAEKIKSGQRVTMTIDGQRVVCKNAATYAFYKYCPHFAGNKLFYDVWRGYRNDL